jgi:hypothetical protein
MHIPSWMKINPAVFDSFGDSVQVGTSFGRTSALLAYLYSLHFKGTVIYTFANTGREDVGTYEFGGRLSEHIPIRCFEVRKPLEFGARPSRMTFEEVPFDRLDRTGRPLRNVWETLAEFRSMAKGLGPIGPNPLMRICTLRNPDYPANRAKDLLERFFSKALRSLTSEEVSRD